ncbi:hypothetical protein [Acetivibrio straminisolvens]|jgi:hypothetical protein|uniref:Uncharacterized protein n=1 Tax=Acetivibrio straminisolvens JCM 21531 TaxID=1294263 RepID=W4VAV2_9FIRM|nr:hypothetical protein [Acetivibrio straminisolvens]GAE90327.1 hypothetical protein JCM21531_3924 [Acetivibrio straminisolvens JCM 21531]
MKKSKSIISILVLAIVVIGIIWFYEVSINISVGNGKVITIGLGSGDWTKKYKFELNRFFGEENWECISKEKKESLSNYGSEKEDIGEYTNWTIRFKNKYGEEETAVITDHVFIINSSKHGLFSPERYSEKQAFYLELMDISLDLAADEIHNDIIKSELTEEEANSVDVTIMRSGNPKPKFYDALAKEEWFTVNKVMPENYLFNELHRFYIRISLYNYRFGKLTEQQKKNVFDSFERIEKRILDKYGDKVSFEMYFDDEHKVKYDNGVKE